MNIILACECNSKIRDAFLKRGHNVWSCDIKETVVPGPHLKGDVFSYLGPCEANGFTEWDMLIGHPPCTFNSLSGSQWRWHPADRNLPKQLRRPHPLYPDRRNDQQESIDFFKRLWDCDIKKKCLENPKPLKNLVFQVCNYTQEIQPWQFGDEAQKTTCLWLQNLPRLKSTNIVDKGEFVISKSWKKMPKWYSDAKKGNKELTQTLRSVTFDGIANAMADQWG